MADEDIVEETSEEDAKPGGKKGLLIGVALFALLGGSGFYASFSGMLPLPGGSAEAEPEVQTVMVATPASVFVPIDRMVISLGALAESRHLKFGAALEVVPEFKEEVENLMPRILDVLNTYLRAVEEQDIESPSAMTRLRAQMLRRVNIVTGDGRVKDLLITEFVLN